MMRYRGYTGARRGSVLLTSLLAASGCSDGWEESLSWTEFSGGDDETGTGETGGGEQSMDKSVFVTEATFYEAPCSR